MRTQGSGVAEVRRQSDAPVDALGPSTGPVQHVQTPYRHIKGGLEGADLDVAMWGRRDEAQRWMWVGDRVG